MLRYWPASGLQVGVGPGRCPVGCSRGGPEASQQLAAAKGKHIDRPKGLEAENLAKVKKALGKGLSVAGTVELTGISLSSVKRYRKYLRAVPA